MRAHSDRVLAGAFGEAIETIVDEHDVPDTTATVASWFLDCPGQSPAWRHYALSIVHLRPIEGVRSATVTVPQATHEVLLVAMNPKVDVRPDDPMTWQFLTPVNVCEQVQLPDDKAAADLLELAARSVVDGILPAEPMLAASREPWRTVLIKTAAHLRGEEHAS